MTYLEVRRKSITPNYLYQNSSTTNQDPCGRTSMLLVVISKKTSDLFFKRKKRSELFLGLKKTVTTLQEANK